MRGRMRGAAYALVASCALLVGCSNNRGGDLLAPLMFTAAENDSTGHYGEPNGTIAQAMDVPTNNTPIKQTLYLLSDVDYFRFLAAEGAPYIIRTEEIEPGVRTRLEIRDDHDQELARDVGGSPEEGASEIRWTAPAAGYYYVRVSAADGNVGYYSLRISVGADGFEPDNSLAQAHEVPVNGVGQRHTLHDRTDEDFVAFAAWADFTYHIALEVAGSAAGIRVSAVDAIGNVLASNDTTPYRSFSVRVPTDGFYYIRITPRDDSALGTYHVAVTPGDDPWEPDSTIAQAKPIVLSRPQRHSFSSKDDQDYIKFEVRIGSIYTIRTDSLSNGVDTQIELNSSYGMAIVSDDNSGGDRTSRMLWQAPTSGMFYVRIRSTATGLPGTYVVWVHGSLATPTETYVVPSGSE